MLLGSCGTDLKLHNTLTYDLVHVYRPSDSAEKFHNISWSKDGSSLALVTSRDMIEIVRIEDDVPIHQTIIPFSNAAVFQRQSKRNLAISSLTGNILIYDIEAKNFKKQFERSGTAATVLDWNVNDNYLATGSKDGKVIVYSNSTNRKTDTFCIPESTSVSAVRFHRNERSTLATASEEGVVAIWDISKRVPNSTTYFRFHKAPITDLAFSGINNKLMFSVGLDGMFYWYDIHAGIPTYFKKVDNSLASIDLSVDGYTIAMGSTRGAIYLYDLRNIKKLQKTITVHSGELNKLLFQPTWLGIKLLKKSKGKSIAMDETQESNLLHNVDSPSTSTGRSTTSKLPSSTVVSVELEIPKEEELATIIEKAINNTLGLQEVAKDVKNNMKDQAAELTGTLCRFFMNLQQSCNKHLVNQIKKLQEENDILKNELNNLKDK